MEGLNPWGMGGGSPITVFQAAPYMTAPKLTINTNTHKNKKSRKETEWSGEHKGAVKRVAIKRKRYNKRAELIGKSVIDGGYQDVVSESVRKTPKVQISRGDAEEPKAGGRDEDPKPTKPSHSPPSGDPLIEGSDQSGSPASPEEEPQDSSLTRPENRLSLMWKTPRYSKLVKCVLGGFAVVCGAKFLWGLGKVVAALFRRESVWQRWSTEIAQHLTVTARLDTIQQTAGVDLEFLRPEEPVIDVPPPPSFGFLGHAVLSATSALMMPLTHCFWKVESVRDVEYDTTQDERPDPLAQAKIKYHNPRLKECTREIRCGLTEKLSFTIPFTKRTMVISEELLSHVLANNVITVNSDYETFTKKRDRVIETFHNLNLPRGRYDEGNIGRATAFVAMGYWHRDRQATPDMDF